MEKSVMIAIKSNRLANKIRKQLCLGGNVSTDGEKSVLTDADLAKMARAAAENDGGKGAESSAASRVVRQNEDEGHSII